MKLIILGTGKWTNEVINSVRKTAGIELVGVIPDSAVSKEENNNYIKKMGDGINILPLEVSSLEKADLIFACEYRKKVEKEYVDNYVFVNCHAGILPRFRGFSSNVWAIINGEKEIGYTIHKMDEGFDSGGIYYTGRFEIAQKQTYSDLCDDIFHDMVQKIGNILLEIYEKKLMPTEQVGPVQYNSRLYPEFGDLKDFYFTSEYITNLYRAMSKPHGTGVYFIFKDKKIYANKIVHGRDAGVIDYIGMHGRIVNIADECIWVKTKDNVVLLSDLRDEHNNIVTVDTFRIGNRL